MEIIICFTGLALVLIGYFFSIENVSKIGGLIVWILMIILSVFRYDGTDVGIYMNDYYAVGNYSWDFWNDDLAKVTQQFGFFYFSKLFYELDYDFAVMHFLLILLPMILSGWVVYKLTSKWYVVVVLYLVFPYMIDVAQNRNYVMSVFLLLGFWLLSSSLRWRRLKYSLSMVGALSFHTTGLIYWPIVFLKKVMEYKFVRLLLIISLLSPLYISNVIDNGTQILVAMALDDTPLQMYIVYTEGKTSDAMIDPVKHFIRSWGNVVLCMSIMYYIKTRLEKYSFYDKENIKMKFVDTVYDAWLYCALLLPFIGLTPSMDRIPRNLMLPMYICLAIYMEDTNKKQQYVLLGAVFTVSILLSGLFTIPDVVKAITFDFSSNYFFNLME